MRISDWSSDVCSSDLAAVQQHAGVAVDVGDRRPARSGSGEARVVGEAAGFLRQLGDLDAGGAERATRHRQRDRLVAGIERDLFDCGWFGHLMHSSCPALPGTGWLESAACRDAAIIAQGRGGGTWEIGKASWRERVWRYVGVSGGRV